MPQLPMRFLLTSTPAGRPHPLAADGDPESGRDGRNAAGGGDGRGGPPPDADRRNPRPGGGPPDLDDLWRDFNRKLNGLFGRRGGGRGGGGFRPPRRPGRFRPTPQVLSRGLVALIVLLALGWLGSGFFVVRQGQVAVVSSLGASVSVAQPGLNWHDPAPFGSAVLVDIGTLRTQPVGDSSVGTLSGAPRSSMLTADGDIVDLRLNVQWRVGKPLDYVYGDRDPDAAVAQASEQAIRGVVASLSLDQVLHGDRALLARQAQQRVQQLLDRWHSGVHVSDLTIQRLQVPQAVRAADDQARKAALDSERLLAQARAYAQDVLPRAQASADALLQQARGYKASVVARAQGDAARFNLIYDEYRKAPQVTREGLYLQTMRHILGRVTKVVVSSKGSNNLIYLPLDRLQQAPGPAAAPLGSASAPGSGAALPGLPAGVVQTLGPGAGSSGTASAAAPSTSTTAPASVPRDTRRGVRDSLRQRDSR